MDNYKAKENSVLLRECDYQLRTNVMYYVQDINNKVMPLLTDLGVADTIEKVISYCSEGGKERLRRDCLKTVGQNTNVFLKTLAEEQFEKVLSKHPEFVDSFNNWGINAILCLSSTGSVRADKEKFHAYCCVYLNDKDSIHIYNQVVAICDMLNKMASPEYSEHDGLLGMLFAYDDSQKKYVPASANINDSVLLEMKNGSNDMRYTSPDDFDKFPKWYKDFVIDRENQKKAYFEKIKKSFGL